MTVRPAVHDYHVPLDDGDRVVAVDLQAMLIDLVDLALIAKQAHWNVEGPRFDALHRSFDELAASCHRMADDVAERARAIGAVVEAQAETVAGTTRLDPLPAGMIRDDHAIDEVAERIAAVAAGASGRIEEVAPLDPVSADLLTTLAASLDKQRWLIRAQR